MMGAGKSDVTNQVYLNGGLTLKAESNQKYATDGEAVGVIRSLCDKYGIPYQMFANRSDVGSGSTLGAIASSFSVMDTAEVGVPLLAMHSARELMGVEDQKALTALLTDLFAPESAQTPLATIFKRKEGAQNEKE